MRLGLKIYRLGILVVHPARPFVNGRTMSTSDLTHVPSSRGVTCKLTMVNCVQSFGLMLLVSPLRNTDQGGSASLVSTGIAHQPVLRMQLLHFVRAYPQRFPGKAVYPQLYARPPGPPCYLDSR